MVKDTRVRDLQKQLRFISRYNNSVLSVIPDGVFGEKTENSVKSFQSAYGMPITGVADYDTFIKITDVKKAMEDNAKKPEAIELIPIYALPVNVGDESIYLYSIQGMLNVLSQINPAFLKVDITGKHDEKTVDAVKTIQRISGIDEDGILDKKTWNAISSVYSALHLL